jgi:protein-S-isoprenylcysteine O-methyltransferase Ste14
MNERTLLLRSAMGLVVNALVMGLLLFVPAGTVHYGRGWIFLSVFQGCMSLVTLNLFWRDRALLERRLKATESRPIQKVFQAVASLAFAASLVIPALGVRRGDAPLPPVVSLLGNGLVLLGFWIVSRVFRENSFTALTIEVSAGQSVTTTGPYALVRHPMYSGGILLLFGVPLALGSAWGLWASLVSTLAIVWRLLDEEKLLVRDLPGYDAYRRQTRYRLIPRVW